MRTPEEVTEMTKAEKVFRLEEVETLAQIVLRRMAIGVEEQGFSDEEENRRTEANKNLVKMLIAKARALGKDFSSVIR